MSLSESLRLKLRKKYQPLSMVSLKFRGKDLSIKTDEDGNPIVLFIGRLQPDGKVKGERYTRTLIRQPDGTTLKDHWDLKGKA